MKAPDKIYINQDAASDLRYSPGEDDSKVEYIRADLTELTWEDIPIIEELINEVHYEYPNGLSAECFGEEVLRRFNEQKKIKYV